MRGARRDCATWESRQRSPRSTRMRSTGIRSQTWSIAAATRSSRSRSRCRRRTDWPGDLRAAIHRPPTPLSERERVRLRVGLEERDLKSALADRTCLAHQLVEASLSEHAIPRRVDVQTVRLTRGLTVDEHPKRNGFVCPGSQHEVCVAGFEAEGDAPSGLAERDFLAPDRPLAREPPGVEVQPLGELVRVTFIGHGAVPGREPLAASVANVGLRRAQVGPVGCGFDAHALDGDRLSIDAEKLLDQALRFLVAPFTEILVADDAFPVDEIQRRPVVVVEGAPDAVVVVDRDRISDASRLHCLPDAVDLVLERELRCVDADDDQPVVAVRLPPRAYVWLLPQPVDACQRPEVDEDDVAA